MYGFVKDVVVSFFIIVYLLLFGCFVFFMMGDDGGSCCIVIWIFSVVVFDIGGYVVGVLCGKYKLVLCISLKKSWEGFVGFVIIVVFVGWVCLGGLLLVLWWVGIVFGVVLVLIGIVGDFVELMIKCDVGIKDMLNFLFGYGGVMDWFDLVLFLVFFVWFVMFFVL